jgi:asparaginyl-tRNA synthetase
MSPTPIRAILAHEVPIDAKVEIAGWVRTRRTSKGGFSFVEVNDGSCFGNVQVVAAGSLPNYGDQIVHLTSGCSVRIRGLLVASHGKGQDREIQAEAVEVVGWIDDPEVYPVSKKQHTFEFLRTVAHLRPRTNTFGAIARLRHSVAQAVHGYFHRHGFVWVNTPIITSSDCEGAGELFRVSTLDAANPPRNARGEVDFEQDFFGRETFLSVSGQLNVESYCLALSKVYTFGPTFRAENSNTSRHLAEFWMVEPEIAFATLDDDAALAEDFLKSVIADVLAARPDDMRFFVERIDPDVVRRLEHVVSTPFVRMDYGEAIDILLRSGQQFEFPVRWGLDLQSEHERYLTEQHVRGPVVVCNYPKEIKAFYMRLNDDGRTVAAMDVLVPGVGEIIGGSQREERIDILDVRMRETGIVGPDVEASLRDHDLWWYRDLRRYGTVPHAGFGLGLERFILYLTGMENIRDVIPFPRVPNNAQF